MPTDQLIEQITDGTPTAPGDLYAVQRQVGGVWTDYFIRAENIAGSGVMMADITVTDVVPGYTQLLPFVSEGKAYIIIDPPSIEISNNVPSGIFRIVAVTVSGGAENSFSFVDEYEQVNLLMSAQTWAGNVEGTEVNLQTDGFTGATMRIRFRYLIADI